jgi:hypothetical protein
MPEQFARKIKKPFHNLIVWLSTNVQVYN